MEKLKIPYPVVVEGKYDRLRLLAVMEGQILTTEGFGIFKKKEKLALLRALAAKTSLYTDEELAEMDERQLHQVLAAGRVETALLITEELREAYYAAKQHEVDFAKRQATADVIEAMGGLYAMIHSAYNAALSTYSSAIKALDEFRYNTFVSAESAYQQKLAELRAAKAEVMAEKAALAHVPKAQEKSPRQEVCSLYHESRALSIVFLKIYYILFKQ